jgi:hypothetical protein
MEYKKLDARTLKCVLQKCVDCATNNSKIFHFCCYAHDVAVKRNKGLNMAQCTGADDVLLDHLENCDPSLKHHGIVNFSKPDGILVFPLCTKRCYNSLIGVRHRHKKQLISISRKKRPKKSMKDKRNNSMENSTTANWDRDGGDGKKPSIIVLVDWITTKENLTKYYGSLDMDGNTNRNQKDAYQKILAILIKNENGK